MSNNVFRKSLVIGIIMLFIGASITPNILIRNVKADSGEIFYPTDDALIKHGSPNTNYASGLKLQIRNEYGGGGSTGWAWDSLIKFDVSSIPSGATISSAKLKLYYHGSWDSNPAGRKLKLYRATSNWNENTVTWNTQPSYASQPTTYATVPSSTGVWMTWDVTSDIQDFIDGTKTNYGWKITDDKYWGYYNIPIVYFRSKEYGIYIPYLEVQTGALNQPPIADAGGPYSSYAGTPIIFSGTNSYDRDGDYLQYRWDWTNDGNWDTSWSVKPLKSYKYNSVGTYTVILQVKDKDGLTDTDTAQVDVETTGFYFAHITDTHIDSTDDLWDSGGDRTKRLKKVLKGIKKIIDPAFIVISGDLAESGNQNNGKDYKLFMNCFYKDKNSDGEVTMLYLDSDKTIPVYICPGNHDYRQHLITDPNHNLNQYKSHFEYSEYGDCRYSKTYNDKINIIALNTGKDTGVVDVGDKLTPEGNGLSKNSIEWLDTALSGNIPNIIFMHHPPINYNEYYDKYLCFKRAGGLFGLFYWGYCTKIKGVWDDGCFKNKKDDFMNLCEKYKVPLVLNGHTHRNIVYDRSFKKSYPDGINPNWRSDGVGNYFLAYSGNDYKKTYYVQTSDIKLNDAYRIIGVEGNTMKIYQERTASTINVQISPISDLNNDSLRAFLHIYDSNGNHLGFNESSGELENEIPGAIYTHYYAYNNTPPVIEASVFSNDTYTFVIESVKNLSLPQTLLVELNYHLEKSGDIQTKYLFEIPSNNTSLKINTNNITTDQTAFIDYNNDGIVDNEIQPETFLQEKAPLQPKKPCGPHSANIDEICSFKINTTDPENNSLLYLFDWGDGSNSSWQGLYPSGDNCIINHSWSTQGIYQVKVKVGDSLGYETEWSEFHKIYIGFNQVNPIAEINSPKIGQEDQSVQFNGSYSYDPDGDLVTYEWDFGDGNNSCNQNPSHIFALSGFYTVSLNVTDNDGLSNETSITIFINDAPKANYSYCPSQPKELDEIQFIDNSSDYYGLIINRVWDFGDGNISFEKNPTHQYLSQGNYTVILTILDNYEGIDNISKIITVLEGNPPQTIKTISQPKYGNNDKWLTSFTEFNLTASDVGVGVNHTYYRIWHDDEWDPLMEYTGNFTLEGEGKHYLEFYSIDFAGNVEYVQNQTHYVDDTSPSIDVIVPMEDEALQDGVTFEALITDLVGVDWVTISIREPGGDHGTVIDLIYESIPATHIGDDIWQLTFDTTQLPDGYYLLFVEANDMLNNQGNETVDFSIRNWAVVELLPSTQNHKAGRTMPVKFSLRIAEAVDPAQPFVRNEELNILIYEKGFPETILQNSTYGDTSKDYRINSTNELYITNFKTSNTPTTYVVEIWRKDMLLDSFEFETVK